jgi:hypothetical protein
VHLPNRSLPVATASRRWPCFFDSVAALALFFDSVAALPLTSCNEHVAAHTPRVFHGAQLKLTAREVRKTT